MSRGSAQGFRELLDSGAAPLRTFGVGQRRQIEQLRSAGFVEIVRRGAGQAVSVLNRAGLEAWVAHHFPAGLDATVTAGDPTEARRTRGVRVYRDSKAIAGTGLHTLLIRLGDARATPWDAVAVFLEDAQSPRCFGWPEPVRSVGLAENRTFFQRADLPRLGVDALVSYDGRLSERTLRWCAAQGDCRFVLMPDYDLVGLDDYRRAVTALDVRVSLYVPVDLIALMRRYGKRELVADQGQYADAVARFAASRPADTDLQRCHAAIRDLALGLEQEALLIEGAAVEPPAE